jgi:hypothetical protein
VAADKASRLSAEPVGKASGAAVVVVAADRPALAVQRALPTQAAPAEPGGTTPELEQRVPSLPEAAAGPRITTRQEREATVNASSIRSNAGEPRTHLHPKPHGSEEKHMTDNTTQAILLKVASDTGEIKGLMTGLNDKLDAHIDGDAKFHADIDRRLAKVENQGAVSAAKISVAGGTIGLALSAFFAWFLGLLHVGGK